MTPAEAILDLASPVVSAREAARYLGARGFKKPTESIRRLVRAGKLTPINVVGRTGCNSFLRTELDQLIRSAWERANPGRTFPAASPIQIVVNVAAMPKDVR